VWGPVSAAARGLWCGALSRRRLKGCGVGPCLCGSMAVVWGPVFAAQGLWCGALPVLLAAQGLRFGALSRLMGAGGVRPKGRAAGPCARGPAGGAGVGGRPRRAGCVVQRGPRRAARHGRRRARRKPPAAARPRRRRAAGPAPVQGGPGGARAPQARARVLMCVGGPPGFLALPLLVSERLLFGFFGGRFGGTRALSRAQQRGGLFASWGDEASVGSRPRTGGAGIKQRHGPPRAHARRGGHGPGGVGTKHEAPGPGQGWGEGKTALAYEGGGGARHARARARTGPQGYRVDGCPRLGKAKRRGRGTGPAGHDGRAKARPGGGAPPRGSGNRKTRVGRRRGGRPWVGSELLAGEGPRAVNFSRAGAPGRQNHAGGAGSGRAA
jgi:hypothetical protein